MPNYNFVVFALFMARQTDRRMDDGSSGWWRWKGAQGSVFTWLINISRQQIEFLNNAFELN